MMPKRSDFLVSAVKYSDITAEAEVCPHCGAKIEGNLIVALGKVRSSRLAGADRVAESEGLLEPGETRVTRCPACGPAPSQIPQSNPISGDDRQTACNRGHGRARSAGDGRTL